MSTYIVDIVSYDVKLWQILVVTPDIKRARKTNTKHNISRAESQEDSSSPCQRLNTFARSYWYEATGLYVLNWTTMQHEKVSDHAYSSDVELVTSLECLTNGYKRNIHLTNVITVHFSSYFFFLPIHNNIKIHFIRNLLHANGLQLNGILE